ncbi:MAG: lipid-A-disaccharide synthase [Pyrinomonadaceae bacterium]
MNILLVAGEDSGDRHAAGLVRALRRDFSAGEMVFFGAAGANMRAEGVETIVESDDFGIVGVPEVLKAVPMFWRVMRRLEEEAVDRKADVAVLVDFPEFNLKLAKRLRKRGIRVVYYISPQIWAWRGYRIRGIRKYVDLLLTILPFEKQWYLERGVSHVEFAGNPLAGTVAHSVDRKDFREELGIEDKQKLVALLPGSRSKEIQRIFPVMLEAAKLLYEKDGNFAFAAALAKSRASDELLRHVNSANVPFEVLIVRDDTYNLLNAADAAAVTSGTATLETAIIGTPQVIVYKTSSLNYRLLMPLISAEHVGLANLIAGRGVFKELIQHDLTPSNLASELLRISSAEFSEKLRREAESIRNALGAEDCYLNAAREIRRFLETGID